ncbi:MAG: hypothetical protein LQ338_002966 [Usnochroma carphineum]|nr:MAG: hypothetical protein LQ338_002966 [Usnochroma carphineum]
MDEFAQTRSPDDLFDDDFTPIDEPVVQGFVQPQPRSQRGRNDRARGRGRGRPVLQQHQHESPTQQHPTAPSDPSAASITDTTTSTAETPTTDPITPSKPSTAFRGDRSATGGTAKPKLTEEELSARLAAAKLNNAKREEAHRLAEADEASFQQREAQASQRRQEEGRARRLMDQEREKNRLRKLGAQGGREWDEGKEDQPAGDPRRSGYRRGAHGAAPAYQGFGDRDAELQPDENGDFRGRGYEIRGARGRGGRNRGRGGRGRGGSEGRANDVEILKPPVPDVNADFPALPPVEPPKADSLSKASQSQEQQQPKVEVPAFQPSAGDGQSWADEVNAKVPSGGW